MCVKFISERSHTQFLFNQELSRITWIRQLLVKVKPKDKLLRIIVALSLQYQLGQLLAMINRLMTKKLCFYPLKYLANIFLLLFILT